MADNKQTIKRYYAEVFGEGRLDLLDELAVPDYVEHDPFPFQGQGIEGLRQRVNAVRSAFNPTFTIEDVIAEGDKVVVRWSNKGTHQGEWFGMPATGREVVISGIDIHLMRDGRMAEHWDEVDIFGLMSQLGAIPQPA